LLNLRPEDSLHKSYLNRLLIEIIDCPFLAHNLAFKGGTCASMLGYLDRFSVDLDFDVLKNADEARLRKEFRGVLDHLALTIIRESESGLFYQLRYPNQPGKRNSLKVSASNIWIEANQYQVQYLAEIDRLVNCQALETMVANKLVAVIDRYARYHTIAGRDIYDIHHFFVHGYSYHPPIILERTSLQSRDFLVRLVAFIKEHVSQRIIDEDLNTLLPAEQFRQIRKILIPETIALLTREIDQMERGA
jgi:hypothetical protein